MWDGFECKVGLVADTQGSAFAAASVPESSRWEKS